MSVLSIPASFHDTPPRGGRTASAPPAPVYRFRDCEVRAGTRDILADGVAQHIEPRAFDALVHLIEHRDRIVTKHELLRSVWGRVEVSDSVVARSIMKVRAAIGDHDGSAPLIRTAHRVGYRFVGEVEAVQERAVAAAQLHERRRAHAQGRPLLAVMHEAKALVLERLALQRDDEALLVHERGQHVLR